MNLRSSVAVTAAMLVAHPTAAQDHRFEADPVVTVCENFVACDVLSQLQRVIDNPRASGPHLRKPRAICLHLSGRHDHAVQVDTRESVVEIIPARAHPLMGLNCGRRRLRRKANLIPFLGAAHEGRKLGVKARGCLEKRRVADALVDRELGAGDHLRRVFGGD
jgi:hypothetical protein